MSVADVDVVVIGAGIAGLAAALELQDHFGEVIVVDASDRPGGVMRTDYLSGYVFERGPNTFQVKAPMLSFLESRGIDNVLQRATPESRSRYLLRDGKLVRVPTSPFGIVTTRLISGGAKWRLFAEPLKTRQDATGESVSEFSARRFGEAVAEHPASDAGGGRAAAAVPQPAACASSRSTSSCAKPVVTENYPQ